MRTSPEENRSLKISLFKSNKWTRSQARYRVECYWNSDGPSEYPDLLGKARGKLLAAPPQPSANRDELLPL
jgi:hypothetical protein